MRASVDNATDSRGKRISSVPTIPEKCLVEDSRLEGDARICVTQILIFFLFMNYKL
jgi:hypothetical protein